MILIAVEENRNSCRLIPVELQEEVMDKRVQRIILLMEQDIRKSFALDEVAHTVNLSPSHLYHLFKSEIGMSQTRYLKMLRVKKAKELLETTFMSIKEIVVAIGATDRSHFVRDFKKQYNMTPTQYRRSLLKAFVSAVVLNEVCHMLTGSAFG
jgi:transcriptional regulator GlxA family with amidase domain